MKYLAYILLSFSLLFLGTHVAHAHFLEIDNSIGGVLHVDPDDNPYVGKEAVLTFALKDTKNIFKAADCSCVLTISANGKVLFTQQASRGNNTSEVVGRYTFPEKAVYTITLKGEPLQDKAFQPFSISYDLRVDRESTDVANPSWLGAFLGGHLLHYILFGGAIVYAFIVILRDKRREKRNTINHE
jgi:hypothetical protein